MPKSVEIKRGRRVPIWIMIKSKKGLCVSMRRRKPHARYSYLKKHSVKLRQKKIAVYAFEWHRKAYIKRT